MSFEESKEKYIKTLFPHGETLKFKLLIEDAIEYGRNDFKQKVKEAIDELITDNKKYLIERKTPSGSFTYCSLCMEDDCCYHEIKINALEELKKKLGLEVSDEVKP